ncbi:MAG: FtsQ-type POTRA domain-containing protein [Actinobacteria bacterium]|nr:FtsQ-type POTRA domain-containing protein [Actinomycetota bacterium]
MTAATRIHPKIKERRVAVTKEAGRRRLKVAGAAGAMVLVAAGLWGLTRSSLLDIDEVRTVGAGQTLLEEVVHAGNLRAGRPMTDVDPAASARGIEKLPWVATAVVERRWPGSIVVTVTERAPVAGVARGDGSWALVDSDGRVLTLIAGPPAGIPHVHDAETVPEPGAEVAGELAGAVAAAAALPESLREVVGGVNLRPGGVELALTEGGVVRLGDPSRQLGEKLRAAATVLRRVGVGEVAVLDVTVPRAPVLARS